MDRRVLVIKTIPVSNIRPVTDATNNLDLEFHHRSPVARHRSNFSDLQLPRPGGNALLHRGDKVLDRQIILASVVSPAE